MGTDPPFTNEAEMLHTTPTIAGPARRNLLRQLLGAFALVALVALAAGCSDDAAPDTVDDTVIDTETTVDTGADSTSDDGDGSAGGEGAEVLALMAAAGLEADLDDDALACIDEVFAGVDLSLFDSEFDPFGFELDDDDINSRSGRMFDECLDDEARVALIGASMSNAELGTDDQVACAAEGFNTLVQETGTYEELLLDEIDVSEALFDLFDSCGMDLGGEVTSADNECTTMLRTIETAIEAYYAANGVYPESYADLVPDYLNDDLSDSYELVVASDGFVDLFGVGVCEGFGT